LEHPFGDTRYEFLAATVFWCAYYGYTEQVSLYISAKLSPLAKCYKQKNLLMGAIMGGRTDIVDLIFSKEYVDSKHSAVKIKH